MGLLESVEAVEAVSFSLLQYLDMGVQSLIEFVFIAKEEEEEDRGGGGEEEEGGALSLLTLYLLLSNFDMEAP